MGCLPREIERVLQSESCSGRDCCSESTGNIIKGMMAKVSNATYMTWAEGSGSGHGGLTCGMMAAQQWHKSNPGERISRQSFQGSGNEDHRERRVRQTT